MGCQLMDIYAGDEIYLTTDVYVDFTEMRLWKKVVVTRTTKTLIFIGKTRFKKLSFGTNLFEINSDTTFRAIKDNDLLKYKRLQIKFSDYEWRDVNFKTLMHINSILLLAEMNNK